jgi:hypothetical protein
VSTLETTVGNDLIGWTIGLSGLENLAFSERRLQLARFAAQVSHLVVNLPDAEGVRRGV